MPLSCLVSFADPVDVIDVDWSSLMPKQPKEPRDPGAALLKFTPGAVLLRVGISKQLAGPLLVTKIKETCQRALERPKGNWRVLTDDMSEPLGSISFKDCVHLG